MKQHFDKIDIKISKVLFDFSFQIRNNLLDTCMLQTVFIPDLYKYTKKIRKVMEKSKKGKKK